MKEKWDIYDSKRRKTGKTIERENQQQLKQGEYHIVVTGIILNSENQILISKRAKHKKFGEMWECNGGSILAGETSLEGIIRELKEELGIQFSEGEAIYLKEIRSDKKPADFKDLWLFKRDIKDQEITFPDGEATDFMWVTIEKFIEMYQNKEIVPTVDFGKEEYEIALKKLENKKRRKNMKSTFIEYPKCSTCKKAKKWLQENNIKAEERNIITETPTAQELEKWIQKSGQDIKKWFNTSGLKYKELKLKDKLETMSEKEKIELLASDGMLIKRPLLISDKIILIGFKEEKWKELI